MYFENEKRSHKRMETRVPTADPGLNARGGHREPEWYAVGQPSPAATSLTRVERVGQKVRRPLRARVGILDSEQGKEQARV